MKKSIAIVLALVFVLGIAGTALAANPFVDVPSKHWAYSAVAQLQKAGLVDGYSDNTFQGDKTLTRYEMAQIVAKAMTKSDKADAATKALLDKLQVEFAAELQNLGVRVANLEKNQNPLKFSGTFDQRYRTIDYSNDLRGASNVNGYYRLRLNATATIDDKTSFGMRFVTNAPDVKNNFGNNSWVTYGNTNQAANSQNFAIDRVFLTTKVGAVNTTVGRQAFVIDPLSLIVDSNYYSFDGVKFNTKMGNFDVNANWGRFYKGANAYTFDTNKDFTNADIMGLTVSSNTGKLNYDLGWAKFQNNTTTMDKTLLNYAWGDVKYLFTDKLSLTGLYGKNTEASSDGTFYSVKAVYGDQVLAKAGQSNFVAQYSDMKAHSIYQAFTTLDSSYQPNLDGSVNNSLYAGDAWTDLDLNYNYAFSKSFLGQLEYVQIRDKTVNTDIGDYNYWKATLTVKF